MHQQEIAASVLPLCRYRVEEYRKDGDQVCRAIEAEFHGEAKLIVRSSARSEDSAEQSNAGKFCSLITGNEGSSLQQAIETVIASYGEAKEDDQFFVQPALEQPEAAGVAFTLDPNTGGNYYVINYDRTGSTSRITDGTGEDDSLYFWFKEAELPQDRMLNAICTTMKSLEQLLKTNALDVEFAWKENRLYLLQCRPLCIKVSCAPIEQQRQQIQRMKRRVRYESGSHPFLYGKKTIYSNMTDWNPAEMLGIHPRPLALSLYKELITDNIWAYQRDNYGYKNLRSFPLLVDFEGYPYIDTRVSFNSFIPADLDANIAEKLANDYLNELQDRPEDHDKAEFNIIFSCYTFDLPKRIQRLRGHGFTDQEVQTIVDSLRQLTNRIINHKSGLWRQDIRKIKILEERYQIIMNSGLDEISRMYWLLEDCKRYGTLPFAGLARAGFIAVQLLSSMVAEEILTQQEYDAFLADVATVGSRMKQDFARLDREGFLRQYGHLRPGTYDITSARYDEAPDLYFQWKKTPLHEEATGDFRLSLAQLERIRGTLAQHGLDDDVLALFSFIRLAIESRESAKFSFTRNLSEILRIFGTWGEKYGISREDCSYADISVIHELYGSIANERERLLIHIEQGKLSYAAGHGLALPSVIVSECDLEAFSVPESQPTYITQKHAEGEIVLLEDYSDIELGGRILAIPAADPGFDWIFSHGIAGFITEYGGANSHMAIRAGELSLPAVIGAGKKLFDKVRQARYAKIDAALKQVVTFQ